MNTIKVACVLTIVVSVVTSLLLLWGSLIINYDLSKAQYDSENVCISHWISQGVERRNIVRSGGTCAIITEYK